MLGQPEILWDEQPLTISRRATRTLLFYLASQRKPVGRSLLCDLFWPDESETKARNNLRGLIAKLKHSLPEPELFIPHNDLVSLDHSQIYVDQHDFTDQYAALRGVPWHYADITPLPKPIEASLVKALALWRGAHFLVETKLVSSLNLDNWLMYTDETLISLRRLCLDRLAAHYLRIGRTKAAVECLALLRNYDEGNPILHHRLISALIQGGFFLEAQRSLDGSVHYFEDQLGVPLPGKIVQDREVLQQLVNQGHASPSPHWPKPLAMHLNLVGRQEELTILQNAFSAGGIFVLKGEAGSGKTRLIRELFESTWPNMRLLLANCTEAGQTIPLQAVIDMLRSSIEPEEWQRLPNLWANFLTLLIPELTQIKPNMVIPDRPTQNKGEGLIFEAVLNLLKIAANKARILFVLDDAHWADLTSLAFIQHLVNHDFFKQHGLLLLSFRAEETNPQLQRLLKSLNRLEPLNQVELRGLSETEVSALVKQVVLRELDPAFIRALTLQTGGNPYLILETIGEMRSETSSGSIDDHFRDLPVARNIQALINHKVSRLDPQCLDCLQAAVVLGFEFNLNVLRLILDQPDSVVDDCIQQLTKSAFIYKLDPIPGNGTCYQFNHMIEHGAVLSAIPPVKAGKLHARAAKALETVLKGYAESQASRIAQHYQLAGETQDAIKWWLRAAKHAWSLFSKDATAQVYQEIENSLTQNQALISDEDALTFFLQCTTYSYEAADLELLERICRMCLEWGQKRKSPLLIGAAFHGMSYISFPKERFHEGLSYLDKAVTYISVTNHPTFLAEVYIRRGFFLTLVNRHQEALLSFDSALKVNQTVTSPGALEINFQGHYQKSIMLYTMGFYQEGLQEIENAYDHYQHILRPFDQARAHFAFSFNLFKLARYEEACVHAEEGLQLAQLLSNTTLELYLQVLLAQYEVRKGNVDKGLSMVREAIRSVEQNQQDEVFMRANGVLGEIYILLEDFQQAEQTFRISTRKKLNSHVYFENLTRLAYALAYGGKLDESESILQTVLDHAIQSDMQGIYVEAMLCQAIIGINRGEFETMAYLIDDLEEKAEQTGMVEILMLVKFFHMMVAGNLGQFDSLDALQKEISDWSQKTGVPWPHLTMIPFWLKYTQKSDLEKEINCKLSKDLIDQIQPLAQSPELNPCFEAVKKQWTCGF